MKYQLIIILSSVYLISTYWVMTWRVGIDIKKNVSLEDLTHWVSGLTEIVSLFSKHDKLEIIKKGKKRGMRNI